MCISTGQSVMSNTLVYTGEAEYKNKYVHVLAYQNKAKSSVPNAMILPFPTEVEMSEDNIIDTTGFSSFLKNISDASKRLTLAFNSTRILGSIRKSAMIFDKGSYTVILAHNPQDIPNALEKLQAHKRPNISDEFLEGYMSLYPNQPIAVCCWSGNINPEPLLWWYEPKDKDCLFIPTMDAHDGKPPNVHSKVYADHIISVGSTIDKYDSNKVYYSEQIPSSVGSLLPQNVFGSKINALIINGDMWIEKSTLSNPTMTRGLFSSKFNATNSIFLMQGWE
jgi:hypothetical protein